MKRYARDWHCNDHGYGRDWIVPGYPLQTVRWVPGIPSTQRRYKVYGSLATVPRDLKLEGRERSIIIFFYPFPRQALTVRTLSLEKIQWNQHKRSKIIKGKGREILPANLKEGSNEREKGRGHSLAFRMKDICPRTDLSWGRPYLSKHAHNWSID